MNLFWASFFEHLKSCGRDATIFLVTLSALALLAIGSGMSGVNMPDNVLVFVLAAFSAAAALSVGVAFRRAWKECRGGRCGRLSSDELRVARSKLVNGVRGFKSVKPAARPPDVDLKY